MNYLFLISFLMLIYLINILITKNKILQSISGDKHQKIASIKSIPLSGGIFLILSIFFFYFRELNLILFFLVFIIYSIGLLSDLKILISAKLRLILQSIFIFLIVYIFEIIISSSRINLIDQFLNYEIFNYIFVTFCVLIIINGTNFIDGLNTLVLGYYIIITFIIFQLGFLESPIIMDLNPSFWILVLFFIYLLNLFDKLYLGDNGAYFLGISYSIFLIHIYENNSFISPYFIILLLWYPGFENLFSILRKLNLKKNSPMAPDGRHLHQLIFLTLNRKFYKKKIVANLVAAHVINFYNFIIFLISSSFISETKIQLFLIFFNIVLYILIYKFLFKYLYLKT